MRERPMTGCAKRLVQHFYLARLDAIHALRRTGHEFSEPECAQYETVHLDHRDAEALAPLRPRELCWILATHGSQLAAEARALTAERAFIAAAAGPSWTRHRASTVGYAADRPRRTTG
jgi:hypothetical protein